MTKSVNNDVLDAALDFIVNNASVIRVCATAAVGTYAIATGNTLVSAVVSGADFTGPADGDTSGRKVTVGAKPGQAASDTANATAQTIVITQTSGSRVLYVTDVTANSQQVIVSGNTVDIGSWVVEIRDPP